MAIEKTPKLIAEKLAEHLVLRELLKRDVLPYAMAVGPTPGFKVRIPTGRTIDVRIESSISDGDERVFQVPDFKPRPELIFICVEFSGDEISCAWVLPSTVFFAYSDQDEEHGLRELNLDVKRERYFNEPFREYNSFFRNRWEPITRFDSYSRYMKPLGSQGFAEGWEDFEDEMMALEILETREPREESIAFDPMMFSDPAPL